MANTAIRREPRESFEQYRRLLFFVAYRMTGSASEAEDLVQDTFLRYQANAGEEIVSLKAYLTTIVTRLALDYLKSARVAREEYIGTWLPEPILTGGDAGLPIAQLEREEALSIAFLRLLETLSPPERAVFLLHEVFDTPFEEIGRILDKSAANCRQIFHRAQEALDDKRVRFNGEPQRQRELLTRFLAASQSGDMAGLTSLLSRDVVSWSDGGGKVQTNLNPIYGQDAVARFWLRVMPINQERLTTLFAEINGSPAILFWEGERVGAVMSVTSSDAGIEEIYALLNPEKLGYLGKQLARGRSDGVME